MRMAFSIISRIKYVGLTILFILFLSLSESVHAEIPDDNRGKCVPVDGFTPQKYIAGVNLELTEDKNNTLSETSTGWDGGSGYTMKCYPLENPGGSKTTLFKTAYLPSLPSSGSHWFRLNRYIDIKSSLYFYQGACAGGSDTSGQYYCYIPFVGRNSTGVSVANLGKITDVGVSTGRQGKIYLRLSKRITGFVDIPLTKIQIFATRGVESDFAQVPVSEVSISGSISVPQKCNFVGSTIMVDLGTINADDIAQKSQKPLGFNEREVQIRMQCSNIAEDINLKLSIEGNVSAGDPKSITTSNPDIGFRIADLNGNEITPDTSTVASGSELPVNFDFATQQATAAMKVYPVNITGNTPTAGSFNGVATLKAEIN